ncbi:hypothetical protein [Nocardiopsis quinghaiensis]|nr:hypothetical protein [Nocardiopsis quinghaiensis]
MHETPDLILDVHVTEDLVAADSLTVLVSDGGCGATCASGSCVSGT